VTPARLAIGLYVYNGAEHLAAAIDSLLSQTMGDFVLDISDNASTDGTEEIGRSYAAMDSRVHYWRHSENMGPTSNCNFVRLASPETEFFKWCADDDVYEPTYLQECVTELDRRPEIVACHARTRYINVRGEELMRSFRQLRFGDERPWVRFHQVLVRPHDFSYSFSVMRRSALDRVRPFQPVYNSDAILLSELAFLGPFGEVPEHLFSNRMHSGRATAVISKGRTRQTWAKWYGGSGRFPLWHSLFEKRRSISLAPLSPIAKARCYEVLGIWMRTEWAGFGLDLALDGPGAVSDRIAAGLHPSSTPTPATSG
jgi:glycosyltransferase involved in cell wall biosynthesis